MNYREVLNEENFKSLKKEFENNEKIPFSKNNIKLTCYRVGSTKTVKRGIFFASDKFGAEQYTSIHPGQEVKKYEVIVNCKKCACSRAPKFYYWVLSG